ncbi:myotrophin-like [Actinia tenebrosa]|uniref:Myotrophin-like n=1 Tax=Actinia tenebrosa TaxID=6105 RepID=A0A6P8HS28_ACTTE|nr:myotrophin-like [Actinia tenebrosa]
MSSHHYRFAEHENFCSAIKSGFLPTIIEHLKKPGSEVNMTVDAGRNALHLAAEAKRENIIRYLLQNGANPVAEDDTGATPLLIAIWSGDKDCVKTLLDFGADPTARSPDDESYVDCAEEFPEIQAMIKKAIKEY